MIPKVRLFLSVLIIFYCPKGVMASTQDEIDHLLSFISNTECSYERNGSLYKGGRAREHIERKFDHYRKNIHSAEDFIHYSATKSVLSGKSYHVHCPQMPAQESAKWLTNELRRYRENGHRIPPAQ